MAGKTTYGRMALLVTLLAQCGSFVPAGRARIGLVDRIFLRSGAGDDIAGGQSTFMVEMTEAAAILRNATPRSLAFFDEIGRGTSTYDGMAIARAMVEWLASAEHGFRAIFSTHYHELAGVASEIPSILNYRMEVNESADRVWFTYRVVPGSADRSYGVHVAQLAGLPPLVITRAREVLASMEGSGARAQGSVLGSGAGGRAPQREGSDLSNDFDHRGLPESDSDRIPTGPRPAAPNPGWVYDLASVNVERTTPLESLQLLQRMQAAAAQLLAASTLGDAPKQPE
jgi:DNA mismatch repair protein MutS